ncbi:MAG TPA: MFS transporter [Streptosporangiaceae bacterium]|nr:MFS transporter [Streptosporangiaceae bacterium]
MSRTHAITAWEPEDATFWEANGRRTARRNLWTSVFAEHIGFSVWSLWSVLVLFMTKNSGFHISPGDKFLLVSVVTLVGSAVRPGYGLAVTRLGGRTWTTLSTLLLLVPVMLATLLMGEPRAPLWAFLLCAAVSGLGGGCFAASTTNINFFFPEREKGRALGINAGGGNLGVASVQLLGLLVIATAGAGHPRVLTEAFIPLLLVSAGLAYGLMDNLPGMRTDAGTYRNVLKDPHCWTVSLLYIGTFGSFIGYSFAFGLVLQNDFGRSPLQAAALTFTGPLLGSLARPAGGWLADRFGPARITLIVFAGLAAGTLLAIDASMAHSLPLFSVAFTVLFVLSGVGNGSTYAMIPAPYAAAAAAAIATGTDPARTRLDARRRTGAVIAFAGTAGGLGGAGINLALRQSYLQAHNARPALAGFLVFYAVCVAVTALARRRETAPAPVPVQAAA